MMSIVSVVLSVFLFYSDQILISIGQDEDVSKMTQEYVLYYMPGLYFFGLCDLYRKFLSSFGKTLLPMLSLSVSIIFHPIWLYIFVEQYKMGVMVIAFAGIISNFLTFVLMKILLNSQRDLDGANFLPDSRIFVGLGTYINLALPMLYV